MKTSLHETNLYSIVVIAESILHGDAPRFVVGAEFMATDDRPTNVFAGLQRQIGCARNARRSDGGGDLAYMTFEECTWSAAAIVISRPYKTLTSNCVCSVLFR